MASSESLAADGAFGEATEVIVCLSGESMSAVYGVAAELGVSRNDVLNMGAQLSQAVLVCPEGDVLRVWLPEGEPCVYWRVPARMMRRRSRWWWRMLRRGRD